MKACIVTIFMDNIDAKTVELQKTVVQKLNKSDHDHILAKVDCPPGVAMDYIWAMNGYPNETFKQFNVKKEMDFDVILFLDVDAIPLCEEALDFYINRAAEGALVGNAQRSNHIENNQHVFAAPSVIALSSETYEKIGRPTARETQRSDVSEEYTFEAERLGISLDIVMPIRYDRPPIRYDWEKDQPPYWPLADGMPVYGLGTTYGRDGKELTHHNFQIRIPGQQEFFWKKCEEVLNG